LVQTIRNSIFEQKNKFCRHHSQLDFATLNDRIYDALAELLRYRVNNVPARTTDETKRLNDDYLIPALQERKVKNADGTIRLLQVPPFLDRVAQLAVARVLAPALDMLNGNLGLGKSQLLASQVLKKVCREDYQSESDFDNIQWSRLYTRLSAFFGDDLIVDLVMGWMSASLEGEERKIGLPNGSLLSPILASIMDNE